jgi:hypothetical protein
MQTIAPCTPQNKEECMGIFHLFLALNQAIRRRRIAAIELIKAVVRRTKDGGSGTVEGSDSNPDESIIVPSES